VPDLDDVARLLTAERHLATVATTRADGSVQASVVSVGVLDHPVTGDRVVALVAVGGSAKLGNLRRRPRATVVVQAGGQWVAVEGAADLAGPDDVLAGVEPADVPGLLRRVFVAAGGSHDDWDEYDRVMAAQRRTAVLVRPERLYGVT